MYGGAAVSAAAAISGAAGSPNSSPVLLSFSANKLPSLDAFSKSDPFVVVYAEIGRTGNWQQVGSTEIANNNSSPVFQKQVELVWTFETEQKIKLAVFDYDGPGAAKHDFIGDVTTTLGFLVAGRGAGRTYNLNKNGALSPGTLTVRCTELKGPNARDTFDFAAKGVALAKKDILSLSDPFLVISRIIPDGKGAMTKQKVWESEKIDNTLNPVWKRASISLMQLCSGNLEAPICFDVYDHNTFLSHTLIGSFQANIHELMAAARTGRMFELIKPKHVGRAGYKNSGQIAFTSAEIKHVPTLLEYVQGGLQIQITTAVDATGSNGHPLDRGSLHYMGDPRTVNEYVAAITAVGNIVLPFDSDGMPVMLGFGGILPGQSEVSHCFPLSLDDRFPHVSGGIEGMINCYKAAFSRLTLSGPTYFAPIIRRTAAAVARDGLSQEQQKFTILIILTDGLCCDIEDTVNAIVEASSLPMSIIIVGVGDGDPVSGFAAMDFLDADGSRLRDSRGRYAERDTVNFVPFRKFSQYGFGAGSALAKEVLAEIPAQVVGCLQSKGIRPNAPVGDPSNVAGASGFGPAPVGAGAVAVPVPVPGAPAAAVAVPPTAGGMPSYSAMPAAGAGYGGYPQNPATLRMPTMLPSAPFMGGVPAGGAAVSGPYGAAVPVAGGGGYPSLPGVR